VHRFFLPPEACRGGALTLDERDSHHAARVLRLTPGETVEVLDGAGRTYVGRVQRPDRRAFGVDVVNVRITPRPPSITLAPALLKGRAMDFLVQKATELGATRIQPLETARTVATVSAADAESKVAGWLVTAAEACKQCGNPWLPWIEAPLALDRWLAGGPEGRLLVASLEPQARLPAQILRDDTKRPGGLVLTLGPEGDWTPEELEALARAGGRPFTLGPLVLRAETAAIAALAVFQQEMRLASAATEATAPSSGA